MVLGIPATSMSVPVVPLVFGGKQVVGSIVGGSYYTNEMLNFCAVHGITPQVEVFEFKDVNNVFVKLAENKVRYRAVLKW